MTARRGEEALRRGSEEMGRTLVRTECGGRGQRHRAEIAETMGRLHFCPGTEKKSFDASLDCVEFHKFLLGIL